jgi:hypothetical protein
MRIERRIRMNGINIVHFKACRTFIWNIKRIIRGSLIRIAITVTVSTGLTIEAGVVETIIAHG